MARPLRIDAPGLLHHVIVRGNERRSIFRDDRDRGAYLLRLEKARVRFDFRLLAYCLMTDHAHLAIRTGMTPLSKWMQCLQTSYAQYFNRRHARVGHLFQGRYKASVVDDEKYFLTLVRYIHLNQVEAGMCARPEQHPWSSAGAFLGGDAPDWLDLDEAWRLIGDRPLTARRAYLSLMGRTDSAELYSGRAIVGDREFVARVTIPSEVTLPRVLAVRDVAKAVAAAFGASVDECRSRRLGRSRLRAAVAYLSREEGEISVARSAKYFGRSESALARSVRILEASLEGDAELRRRLARVGRILRETAPVRVPVATASAFRNARLRR